MAAVKPSLTRSYEVGLVVRFEPPCGLLRILWVRVGLLGCWWLVVVVLRALAMVALQRPIFPTGRKIDFCLYA